MSLVCSLPLVNLEVVFFSLCAFTFFSLSEVQSYLEEHVYKIDKNRAMNMATVVDKEGR
jgi:hypothetical protein